ncbi:MAG: DegT/DnrJ/EryC1/StrS family aminotransferase [Planctomycetia bacterium]|nr:DegT/DnrJ/EryC1/StrS family aminotransferase [Planctomycetia bacterium]MBL6915424.1 DegT/DnrJ/EryC1/StrS family aminotransferase [Planctomycetota bacterium]
MNEDQRIRMVAVGPDDAAEKAAWLSAVEAVIDQNGYCLGSAVETFENSCKEQLDVEHAFGVSNGTDGLKICLKASGVQPGDEVILPAYSFFSTASVIRQLGAHPVFVDLDPGTLCIDTALIESAITDRTRAIMPVQLYGQTSDMDSIMKISSDRNIPVVEDAAQSFGVRYKGNSSGAIGSAGAFSFYPTKNLAAAGDAGMVVTNDDKIATQIRQLRVHGDTGGYCHESLGWNARMDGFQGAILSVKLGRLKQQQDIRERNATEYLRALSENNLLDRIKPLERTPGSEHCWHQFIIQTDARDLLREQLASRGIDSGIYYPGTLPSQPCFADLPSAQKHFPVADNAALSVLALPVHHRLNEGDPSRVIKAMADIMEAAPH